MDEHQILTQINTLVDQEHQLRTKAQQGELTSQEEHDRLAAAGGRPGSVLGSVAAAAGEARVRPERRRGRRARSVETVEKYLQ